MKPRVGVVLGGHIAPTKIPTHAHLAEDLGFQEVWLLEDLWFTGGIAGASAALSATRSIPIGVGVVSAILRNPAILAIEIATLAHLYPERFLPGIGLGFPPWLEQVGVNPRSPLGVVRESVTAVRRLLDGEALEAEGDTFTFRKVQLHYPPPQRVPLYVGALAPRMLQLSGEIAEGSVSSVLSSVEYVRWMRAQIDRGRAKAGRSDHHRLVVYALCSVDRDRAVATRAAVPILSWYLAAVGRSPLTEAYGIADEVVAMGGAERLAQEIPERWVRDLAVVGNPSDCIAQLEKLFQAGADAVCLFPLPTERSEAVISLAGAEVVPRFA
ncbi:MAG: LLM class flavin-dependent oxidoreductase [Candidatus Binatia bacterium]